MGDFVVLWGILGDVGVEQIEGNAPDPHQPDLRGHGAAGKFDGYGQGFAVFLLQLDRERIEVVLGVSFLLKAVGVQILPEISLLIEQSDAEERESEVACRLEMITGEDAEASRIVRYALREAKLSRKIRNAGLKDLAVRLLEPAGTRLAVFLEFLVSPLDLGQVGLVTRSVVEPFLLNASQKADRIMLCLFPEIGVEPNEELHEVAVPHPCEVVCQFEQAFQPGWNGRVNGIGLDRSYHRVNPSERGCRYKGWQGKER